MSELSRLEVGKEKCRTSETIQQEKRVLLIVAEACQLASSACSGSILPTTVWPTFRSACCYALTEFRSTEERSSANEYDVI